jgi:hypothetical protein
MSGLDRSDSFERDAQSWRRFAVVGTVAHVALVLGIVTWLLRADEVPPWAGPLAALACTAVVGAILARGARFSWAHEGVEQAVYARSTSTAFTLTLVGAAMLGFLEAFARMEPLSSWWIYLFGVFTWVATTFIYARRIS